MNYFLHKRAVKIIFKSTFLRADLIATNIKSENNRQVGPNTSVEFKKQHIRFLLISDLLAGYKDDSRNCMGRKTLKSQVKKLRNTPSLPTSEILVNAYVYN